MRPLFRKRAKEGTAEFHLCHPENLLLVRRKRDGGVLVCATADNLSTEQQSAFIRYLSEEGFVSGALIEPSGWLLESSLDCEEWPVRWIIDPTWPEIDPVYARHIQRLCWYVAGTTMVWLALIAALVCC